jgi:ribosomal protein L31E
MNMHFNGNKVKYSHHLCNSIWEKTKKDQKIKMKLTSECLF